MEMSDPKETFTEEQVKLLKSSAEKLRLALYTSTDLAAIDFLNGEIGCIIEKILNNNVALPIDDIPHFDKMTRGYLPDIESEYFNFYCLAKYGKPAYEN